MNKPTVFLFLLTLWVALFGAASEVAWAEVTNGKEARKKGVTMTLNRETRSLVFESSDAKHITHVTFRLYNAAYERVTGGTKKTTVITKARFEVDIPPSGSVTFKIPDGVPESVDIVSILRKDLPAPSLLKPKNP